MHTRSIAVTILVLATAACDRATPAESPALAMSDEAAAHALHMAGAGGPPGNAPDLALIRSATSRYQQFDRAVEDGFVPLSGRVDRIMDPAIDARAPEILLYEPMRNGRMRLVGVEFMVAEGDWYGSGNTEPPAVAGRAFDAPNSEHPDPMLRDKYTLHVWTWQNNRLGMFAPFNPAVSCEHAPPEAAPGH